MCAVSIKDITVDFNGEDLSKYGLFPLFAWYLNDVIRLPEHFAQVSVNRKRNNRRKKQGRPAKYTDKQMCMGLYHLHIQMHLFLESARGLKGFSLAHESGDTTC